MAEPGSDTPLDIRPIVAGRPGNQSVWFFVATALILGCLLFYVLEAKRSTAAIAPFPGTTDASSGSMVASPPDLQIPPPSRSDDAADFSTGAMPVRRGGLNNVATANAGYAPRYPIPMLPAPPGPFAPPRNTSLPSGSESAQPAIVYGAPPGSPVLTASTVPSSKSDERVIATRFQNPSTTIPKGTIIQAVLETALDSNHGGFARALVSVDVFGFDGTQVLVPRGSRLVGEYKADLGAGQNRALVQWQRLMRPDGVMINLDSPSADPLGRAGIKGKVNGHFLERFGGAILQSTLNLGAQLAARSASRDTVVLALPGTMATSTPTITQDKVQRTLSVREGASVSVFVSRDLDFSAVGQ